MAELHVSLLHILFPEFCLGCFSPKTTLCDSCRDELTTTIKTDPSSLFSYKNKVVRAIIRRLKTRENTVLLKFIAKNSAKKIKESILSSGNSGNIFITVIPRRKKSSSPFDHGTILGKYISKELSLPCRQALYFVKDTKKQSLLSKESRKENMENSMKSSLPNKFKNYSALVVDDVTTTGATLAEAKRVLLLAGIKRVYVFTIAC